MKLLKTNTNSASTLQFANDVPFQTIAEALVGVASDVIVELYFPKYTDGRAFSQAHLLRRQVGFKGDIRATGDVLIDQLVQMQRTGFTSAVLREDQDAAHGEKLLTQYAGFYQKDVTQ